MLMKSPTENPISFGLPSGSGHCMVLGPEGEDVPQMFVSAAFAAGALPADEKASEFVGGLPPDTPSTSNMGLIEAGIKTMLEREEPGDFTAAGLPDRRRLSKVVGLNVSSADAVTAWRNVSESV
jgi:hypothetical protein